MWTYSSAEGAQFPRGRLALRQIVMSKANCAEPIPNGWSLWSQMAVTAFDSRRIRVNMNSGARIMGDLSGHRDTLSLLFISVPPIWISPPGRVGSAHGRVRKHRFGV